MQPISVMVVEDEGLVSLFLQKTLKEFGYQIAASAFSGEEALSKAILQKPDLILMDYQLKGHLSGVETAKLIKQTLDVPVIFLTAYSNKDTIEEIIKAEPFGYLLKPVDERVLYTTIETAITRYRLETKLEEQEQLVRKLNEDLEFRVKERTHELKVANHELKIQIGLRNILENELHLSLEKEKELSDLKTRFIATTSHEFRTPLSIILSSSEMLGTYGYKWSEEKKKDLINRIIVAVKHMTTLLQDILFLNKDDAGKLEFKPEPRDLGKLIHEIMEEARSSDQREWIISLTESEGPQIIWVDEKLLHQILNNLLSNAMKYSPTRQEIDIELRWRSYEVEIRVHDYGIGIPAKDQANLFDSFFRADNVGSIGGTGLGLTILKRAVDHHGGSIKVESIEGAGSTFIVSLPITLPPAPEVASPINDDFNKGIVELDQHWSLLERALEATKTGIIIIDQCRPDWPIVYCNSGFEQMTGYSRDEILGQNYRFLLDEDHAQPGITEVRTAMMEGRESTIILRNYRKDGTLFLNELNLSPVKDNGGSVINIIGTMHDVTRQYHQEPD